MSQRTPLIAGNWKMHKTPDESVAFVQNLQATLENDTQVEVVVAPTSLSLYPVSQVIDSKRVGLSAQNVHPSPKGAFTGEVAPSMLQALGCNYCIVGHSERRQIFLESDDFVQQKVEALLQIGIRPILCIGESLQEREDNLTFSRVSTQLTAAFQNLDATQALQVVVAYEPIWAIGTGKTATPEQAQEVHAFLRSQLQERFDAQTADAMRILYGGSVKPNNVKALMQQPDIDGALVGGASLEVDSFLQLVRFQS